MRVKKTASEPSTKSAADDKHHPYEQLMSVHVEGASGTSTTPLLEKGIADAEYAKEVRKEEAAERLKELDELVTPGTKRDWQLQLKLIFEYIKARGFLMFEIWIIVFAMYYSDVILDFVMLRTFYVYGDYKFMLSTMSGIFLGIVSTFISIASLDKDSDTPRWVYLVVGFLLPMQLHMAFLCAYSTYKGKVHHMVYASKFAESVLEATCSAAVQTYAVIFRDYTDWDVIANLSSVSLSYMSIAYAFTNFDNRRNGLQGLPGVSQGWGLSLAFVYLFRVCDIVSRLTTWGLFQLCVRNEVIFKGFGFQTYGLFVFIGADVVLMALIIFAYQGWDHWGNLFFAIPSAISWMNPMLLKPNAFTMPAGVYYSVRFLEMCAMVAVAWKVEVFHGGHGKADVEDHDPGNNLRGIAAFKAEFYNDELVMYAAIISTTGVFLLLPIIRRCLSNHVMLLDRTMFFDHTFSPVEDALCENLLSWKLAEAKGTEKKKSECIRFHHIAGGLIADPSAKLQEAVNHQRHMRRASFLEEGEMDLMTPAAGSSRANLLQGEGICTDLEKWLENEYNQAAQLEQESQSAGHLFLEAVRAGHNLHKWLKSSEGFVIPEDGQGGVQGSLYFLEYLNVINRGLRCKEVRRIMENPQVCRSLLRIIPEWPKMKYDNKQDLEPELLLFEEKCKLIANVSQCGWPLLSRRFVPIAREFNAAFDARLGKEIEKHIDTVEGFVDPDDWVLRLQMHALVEMYGAIPTDYKFDDSLMSHPEHGLFRKDRELQAIADGAEIVKQCRNDPVVGILKDNTMSYKDGLKLILDKKTLTKDTLAVKVDWDRRWQLNKILGVLTTAHEVLKLKKVSKKKRLAAWNDETVDEKFVSNFDDVKGFFGTDEKGDFAIDFDQEVVSFEFIRAKEIEPQTVESLKSHWPVNQTALLRIVSQIPDEEISFLCGADGRSGFSPGGDEIRKQFKEYRELVETDAMHALDDQFDRMKAFGKSKVDPNTAVTLEWYRSEKKKTGDVGSLKSIKDGKSSSQTAMSEYEDINEVLTTYLRSMKESPEKFKWSPIVCKYIDDIDAKLRQYLKDLRRQKDAYWNKEDGLFQRGEEQRRKEAEKKAEEEMGKAVAAGTKAKQAQEKADQDILAAQEEAKVAREQVLMAQQQKQEAEDEKTKALKDQELAEQRLRQAEKDQREAEKQQREALQEQVKAINEKFELEQQRKKIVEDHKAVIAAYYAAKKDLSKDVAWFEPLAMRFEEIVRSQSKARVTDGEGKDSTPPRSPRSPIKKAASASTLS